MGPNQHGSRATTTVIPVNPLPPGEPFDRAKMLQRLAHESFDLIVVGGGITGLGVALDAATRGLRVALIERDDFASGTSSKSSKLIHGGLRYLQQGEVRLVYEALYERQRLLRNAPHLVTVLPFMLPILTRDGLISRKIARALGSALWMYDFTGGLRIGRFHRRIRKARASAHIPTINTERLASAYIYFDAQADDARLCLALARSAADHGAVVVNYVAAEKIVRHDNGSIAGINVRLTRGPGGEVSHEGDSQTFLVQAPIVVNAAGVWCDEVRRTEKDVDADTIRPAKGVHITLPWSKVRNDIAVVIPVPKDRRSLFVIPWGPLPEGGFSHTYVGTTDTDYRGPIDDPQCTKEDIDYVLRALNASLTSGISAEDVTGVWAGLRPLVKQVNAAEGSGQSGKAERTADLSRRHLVSSTGDGIITVTGGKLTTYREMAEDAVDEVLSVLRSTPASKNISRSKRRCQTRRLRLHGAPRLSWWQRIKNRDPRQSHFFHRYGTDAPEIEALIAKDPELGLPLVDGLAYRRAEVVYAVHHEMVVTLEDLLSRRTRALLFDRNAAVQAAGLVAELAAPVLGWDQRRIETEIAAFLELCAHEEASGQLAEVEIRTS